ncbi:MAG: hypothetical protein IKA88_02630 [Clostridia bacterium]|nr:hypothetical protein [Clostridia bacterium]
MKDLTKGNIYKNFFAFGIPMILAGLLSTSYGLVDSAIAGKFIGENALAATGSVSSLLMFTYSIFWGFSTGFSMYIAKLFGAKEYHKIKASVYSMLIILAIVGGMLSATMIACYKPLFRLMNVQESVWDDAFRYYCVCVLGLYFLVSTNTGAVLLNALGISSYTFWMSLISAVGNVGGNLFFVLVLDMGVEGLAIASVGSCLVVDACYFIKFRSCLKELGVKDAPWRFSFAALRKSFAYSLPNTAQQLIMYLAPFITAPYLNQLGTSATAGADIGSKMHSVCNTVYGNSSRVIGNFVAQCIGKKEYHKLKKGAHAGLLQGIVLSSPFILSCIIFRSPFCSFFLNSSASPETREYALLFAKRYLVFCYFHLLSNFAHGFFRGAKAMGHLFFSTLTGVVARYVFTVILVPLYGLHGYYIGSAAAWIFDAITCLTLYFIGAWHPLKAQARRERRQAKKLALQAEAGGEAPIKPNTDCEQKDHHEQSA